MKRLSIVIILACMLLAILAPGCASSKKEGSTNPKGEVPQEQPSTQLQRESTPKPSQASSPAPPITVEVSFPDGAPPINQEAEFKVVAIANMYTTDIHFDTILPEGFELISGNLSWSTNRLSNEPTEIINAQIKAVKTGEWTIETRATTGSNAFWKFAEGGGKYPIYVAVNKDSAEWGVHPPWSKKDGFDVPVKKVEAP